MDSYGSDPEPQRSTGALPLTHTPLKIPTDMGLLHHFISPSAGNLESPNLDRLQAAAITVTTMSSEGLSSLQR